MTTNYFPPSSKSFGDDPFADPELVLGLALADGTRANIKQAEARKVLMCCGLLSWCSLAPCSHSPVRGPRLACWMMRFVVKSPSVSLPI